VLDEFVKLARIKGVSGWSVVWKHALKMLSCPFSPSAHLAILITGAILVETVFAWPGIRQLISGHCLSRFSVIQAVVLLTAVIVVSVNFVVDITYGYLTTCSV
jgi:ABC-type dipeptide/oligopeptide/nickel transport system permease component